MKRLVTLLELQRKQKIHDEQYHRDIYFLSHQERFKHIAFHFGKYTGRLAHLALEKGRIEPSAFEFQLNKTLTDSFIIVLNAAEIFGMDLDKEISQSLRNEPGGLSLNELARKIAGTNLITTDKAGNRNILEEFLLEYAVTSQIIHKACDSLDHMEGIERSKIMSALIHMLILLLVMGFTNNLDYEFAVPARWKEIEQSKLL